MLPLKNYLQNQFILPGHSPFTLSPWLEIGENKQGQMFWIEANPTKIGLGTALPNAVWFQLQSFSDLMNNLQDVVINSNNLYEMNQDVLALVRKAGINTFNPFWIRVKMEEKTFFQPGFVPERNPDSVI